MTATPTVGSTFFGLDISQFATRLLSMRRRISKRVLVLEFGSDFLLLAEAILTQAGVQLSHVSSISLPPEALDRGVPAEPLKMARLIQDFCAEKNIPAHRVAVVLPPELAFQRLLDLPANLTTDEAREYVLNPANGLQIPFPLTQTDFDLFPVSMPMEHPEAGDKHLYMLTAIPEVLVDPIVEMLQAADLELQLLELGSHSQLRNHAAELITLGQQQVDLVLELLPDCSNLILVSCSGLLGSERLAAIRNLPALDLEPEQLEVAVGSGLSAEDLVLKDESYFPLSDLDLRVLVADLRSSFERFHLKAPGAEIRRLILTGANSSHPLLADLLAEMLGVPVLLSRSGAVTGLAGLSMGDLLLQSSLGRLTGLALGLLPNDQLLACSLDVHGFIDPESQHQNDAVAIADLLSSSEAQTGLDLLAVEASSPGLGTKGQNNAELVGSSDVNVEELSPLDPSASTSEDLPIEVVDQVDHALSLPIETIAAEELPRSLTTGSAMDEEPLEIVLEETNLDSASEQEWPTISSLNAEYLPNSELVVDSDSSSDSQWPSINGPSDDAGIDKPPSVDLSDSSAETPADEINSDSPLTSSTNILIPETEWPSIAAIQQPERSSEENLDAEEESAAWPSISLDIVHNVVESDASLETREDSVSAAKGDFQDVVSDELISLTVSDQSSVSDKLSAESLELVVQPEPATTDQKEDLLIPDLALSEAPVERKKGKAKDEEISIDSIDMTEEIQELGDLRFADDEN